MKPFLKWAGGKRRLLPSLLPLVTRSILTYYEPFLGGGAMFFAIAGPPRFTRAVISDVNVELVRTYRAIQRDYAAVLAALGRHVHTEEHYYEVRAQSPADLGDAECAARMIYLNKTGFNGLYRVNKAGRFNVPFGDQPRLERFADPEDLRIAAALLDIESVDIGTSDFAEAISGAGERDFVYLDPPYEPVSKTANFTGYARSGFSQDDQRRVLAAAKAAARRGARVVISNSDCAFTRELYAAETVHEVTRSGSMNSATSKRGKVAELVVEVSAGDDRQIAMFGAAEADSAARPAEQRPLFGGEG